LVSLMLAPATSILSSSQPLSLTITASPAVEHHTTFRELLSELNPLQYLPIIGTIYRAVTGDTIPETARQVGSFVASGVIGGPIGLATSAALLAIEKITGIDPEKIGHNMLASIGIGSHTAAAEVATPAAAAPVPPAHVGWSPSQLMAYGVTTTANGTMKRGDVEGADVLNDLALAQYRQTVFSSIVA
jgi:hypothetical protein